MKTSPRTASGVGEPKTSIAAVLELTGGRAPLPSEILLQLGSIVMDQSMAHAFGELNDMYRAQGVMAGIVIALHEILPAEQFRSVMVQWDIDAIKLSELLHVAGGASRTGNQRTEGGGQTETTLDV